MVEQEPQFNIPEPVRAATPDAVQAHLDHEIEQHVKSYEARSKSEISARIRELDREWDIERLLELNASSLALTGSVLGAAVNKKWLALPAVVLTFLVQHAIQGWCPPIPLFRRLGVRTRKEIDLEKYALKVLRGDFGNARSDADDALDSAGR
ncbi:DUF2892 domain-containing protein [Pseudarthrobacter quantipunctorum]|uniref:DUF2892 domain-containing protein n=1 Tax=Pseudarthrobacter quantipunctorum TaxID=3128980 RepID=A0ABZ2R6Q0_9MICC